MDTFFGLTDTGETNIAVLLRSKSLEWNNSTFLLNHIAEPGILPPYQLQHLDQVHQFTSKTYQGGKKLLF
jgi:hypothetical protein